MKTNKTESQASAEVAAEKTVAPVQQEPTRGGTYVRTPETGVIAPITPTVETQPAQE